MLDKFRALFLSMTIVAILFFSAFGTITPAYADDGTSTAPTQPAGTPAPSTDGAGTPIVTDAPTDAAATPVVTDAPTDAAVTPVVTVVAPDPILQQLPDNTTVAVVNANGEAQPLVSQASANAILLSDPIWCPAGQSPTPGANGCTQSYSSFTALLTYLKANEGSVAYQQAGTIYVQQGAYAGGESTIDFNSYGFTNLNQQNLTITGGWDTVNNTVTSTSQFTTPIIIGTSANPWVGSLSFNNIVINNVGNQTGLTAYSQSNVTLSNVQVTNSLNGANLNSGNDVTVSDSKFDKNKNTGATINAVGKVKISNTTFNNNGSSKNTGKGLEVTKASTVSLDAVNANNNQVFGANIKATGVVTITNSFFSGNKSYTSTCKSKTASGGYGLQVVTTDAVSLDGVTASSNYFFGAHLEGSKVEVFNSYFDKNGSGSVSNPVGKGLEITSSGTASLFAVEANDNQLFGANIKAAGDVFVNNSLFNGNQSYTYKCNQATTYLGYGLQVITTGFINLNNDAAMNNSTFGAHLDGAGVAVSFGNFSNNSSNSNDLTGRGLEVISADYVSLSNVTADNNQKFGANIQAVGSVTINASEFSGNITYTYSCKGQKSVAGGGYGLNVVTTTGAIDFTNVTASGNYLYGANLNGSSVQITGGYFKNNGSGSLSNPVGYGLQINSANGVSLTTIDASNNQLFGANVKANGFVNITNSIFSGNQSYASNCKGKTYQGYGLQVVTTGFASLSNITAENNYLYGAHVTANGASIAFSSFSTNGTGLLSDHIGEGLDVKSTGGSSVSLFEVIASGNQLFGANIAADGYVSVSNSVFSGNVTYTSSTCKNKTYGGYGLQVVTTNDILLDTVTADKNGLFGAHLEGVNVTIDGVSNDPSKFANTFDSNGSGDANNPTGKGLEIVSTGTVTLNNVSASNNQLFGANIQTTGPVSVTNSVFSGNIYYTAGNCKGKTANGYGLQVVTTNNIKLDHVTASNNGLYGATLNGNTAPNGSLVEVYNSTFENNVSSHGLVINADVVKVDNVSANNNGVDGAIICANDVSVTNSIFENNGRYGLNVGAPVFSQSGNTFSGNGAVGNGTVAGLNYNPNCNPTGNGNGNHGHGSHDDHEGEHGHHDGGDKSDHRCSSDKSDDKHGDDNHGHHDGNTSDSRCSSDKSGDKHSDNKSNNDNHGNHDGKTSDSRCSSSNSQSHGKKD